MQTPSDHIEDEQEQLNRQLGELLQELRVAMPGVQILFAFLLAVPFNQRFGDTTQFQRDIYLVTLLCAAVASATFVAPVAYHRLMFRHRDKPHLIKIASRFAIAGLIALALAMSCAVLLVVDFLFSALTGWICFGFVLALFGWLWFGLALSRRARGEQSH